MNSWKNLIKVNKMSEKCKHKDYEIFDKLEDTILAECKECGEILVFELKKPQWFEKSSVSK